LNKQRTGIILANTGTPSAPTPAAVKLYLKEFLSDDRIRPMNKAAWSIILNACILPTRSKKSAQKYKQIWTPEGSPLSVFMQSAAQKLAVHLAQTGHNTPVAWAYTYGSPSIEQAFKSLIAEGVTRIIVLPMYPQSAHSTTSCVAAGVKAAQAKTQFTGNVSVIGNYFDNSTYIQSIANSITRAGFDAVRGDTLLMSYHSVPLADIAQGDTYNTQTQQTSKLIAGALNLSANQWQVSYQCRFDKARKWLSPFTANTLTAFANKNAQALNAAPQEFSRIFMVCPNFSIDCLETLYDINIVFKETYIRALAAGTQTPECIPAQAFTYVPCLNNSPAQIETLASVLAPHISPTQGN
jgi:ferrochelatase